VSQTIRLSDGGKLNVSDTDFRTNLGRRIEGRGVRPDLVVAIRTSDLLLSNDLPLQSATDLLGRQIVFGDRYGTVDFTIRLPRDELTLSPGLSQY
jgi:C-terminal processing protease CtpA/Prc